MIRVIDLSIKNHTLEPTVIANHQQVKKETDEIVDYLCGDQIGLRDEIVREKGYVYVGKFNKYGLARATLEDRWNPQSVLINRNGEKVVPEDYEGKSWISDYSEGLAAVTIVNNGSQECYFIDESGNKVNDKIYQKVEPYKFGQALVMYKGMSNSSYYQLIDRQGNEIRKNCIRYDDDLRWSKKGFLGLHETNRGAWYITPDGKRIPQERHRFFEDGMGDLNQGVARVQDRPSANQDQRSLNREKDPWYFINQEGQMLTEGILAHKFRSATNFYQDRAFVETMDNPRRLLLIDIHGNIHKELDLSMIPTMGRLKNTKISDGVIILSRREGDKWLSTAIDIQGITIIEAPSIGEFSEGMGFIGSEGEEIQIKKDGKTTFFTKSKYRMITKTGTIIEPEVEINAPGKFHEGIAKVERYLPDSVEKESFYIDKKGRKVF